MSGEGNLAGIAGKGMTVNIKGKDYKLSVLTIDDLAEFQKYVKAERLRTFLEVAKDLEPKVKVDSIAAIMAQQFTVNQMTEEMRGMDGTRYFLWRSLRVKQPNIKLDQMGQLVDLDNFDEVATIVQGIGGKAVEKNVPGGKASK